MFPRINTIPAHLALASTPTQILPLVVVGDHPDAGSEYAEERTHTPLCDTMCVNNAYRHIRHEWELPRYVSTLHSFACANPEVKTGCVHEENVPRLAQVWGLNVNGVESPRVDETLDIEPRGGTSTLFACVVGLWLGYKQIHVVGCHLDEEPYNDPEHLAGWHTWWKPFFRTHVGFRFGPLSEHYPIGALPYSEEAPIEDYVWELCDESIDQDGDELLPGGGTHTYYPKQKEQNQ